MDQLKQILAAAQKHHFWILSGLALVMGLGGWFYTTGELAKDYDKEASEIKSKEQAARTIATTVNHPNKEYVDEMDKIVQKYRTDVQLAWQRKWEAQQEELAWPTELNVRGTDFTDAIDGLLRGRPIEAVPDEDLRLAVRLRERYRDYIKEELPKLAERIGAKWAPTAGTSGRGGTSGYGDYSSTEESSAPTTMRTTEYGLGSGRGRTTPAEKPPLVVWNPGNQGDIQSKSFDWSSRSNNTPTTKEVIYTQENLWVLENLMDIIARTNGAITEPHQATIKRIDSIEFGREALAIRSRVAKPRSSTAGGRGTEYSFTGESTSSEYDSEYSTESSRGPTGEGSTVDPATLDPAHLRYVDKDYQKLKADELKSAMAAPSGDKYYLAVAKRLPVRMRLRMDQRKLDKLLVECGNANLMVEVRQVRVNGQDTGGRGGRGGYSEPSTSFSDTSYDESSSPASYDEGGRSPGRIGRAQTDGEEKIFEVPVEIYGIIYIYNPVNRELLGVEEDDFSDEDGPGEGLAVETAAVGRNRR